jgi:phosphoglycerate dehydrogenase-like enzyme
MNPILLILSSRAPAYAQLVRDALPDLPLLATSEPEQARAAGADFPIVLADPGLLRPILDDLRRLRWVQSTWAGVDALLHAGLRRDYVLTNVRGVFGPAVAEYVLGYAIMHARLGWQRFRAQQQGVWDQTSPGSLQGKTLGILGVGSIGAYLAGAVKPFGLRVLGYTARSESCAAVDRYYHGDDLYAFAAACDYVVCTLPNTPQTRHLIDAGFLAAMPPHAVLINVGRGATVDEAALVAALEQGSIGGAVLDVFEREPLPPDHPLWRLPNVLITSHTAAVSFPEQIAPLFVENYRRWAAGDELLHRVSFDAGY